ncbi:hypothetical protein [Nitrososphaera sp.]|uniref:hypothetical protein n=1 Tax=Nitrososphaera sp. TaxID=1971748 RepID=UPI00307CD4CC
MNPQAAAYWCSHEVLAGLGEPTMQSLVWHMAKAGVHMAPENFDMRAFAAALHDLLGGGADVILDQVAKSMARRLQVQVAEPGLPALERITRIMEVAQKAQ